MALPAAVQRQVEEAEALQQQLYPTEQVTEQSTETPTETVEDAVATEAQPNNVVELQRNAEPTPQPAEAPKAREDDPAYWRKRFETVQGILNAEMPRLNAQLKEQGTQIQTLVAQLQEKSTATEQPETPLVTSKDAEDFGADLIDMVRRVSTEAIRKEYARAVADLRKEFGDVKELQAQVGHVAERVGKSESEQFWDRVRTFVPDWATVDQDPSWIEFLDTTPDFAEDTYRVLASKAIQKGDAQKVARLVELWRGPKIEAVPTTPATPKPDLQRQVTPSSSRASTPTPPAGKIWSRADYEAAMDPRNISRLGAVKADQLMAEATAAVAEGRVRW